MSNFGSEQASIRPGMIDEESETDIIEDEPTTNYISKDDKRRQSIIPSSHQLQRTATASPPETELNQDEQEDEANFDSFILSHFSPFSGTENVIDWLDNTDKKFNLHKISRHLRYIAIPLLVGEEAKRKYIRNRNNIQSFDDFYEFLLVNYDTSERASRHVPFHASSYASNQSSSAHDATVHKNVTFDDQQKQRVSNLDLSDNLPPRPILRSTALADFGATNLFGDDSLQRSAIATPSRLSHTTSNLDQTTYVIHKAIVDNLIKNPKVFQGGKEDVKQWLEDIEQLFDIAQIPDSHKLDLISYSLRGEARRWYKNTKSSLKSWSTFVKEIKEALRSPFHDELAFKKLESYTQGVNQPVRSFYNEVLKLCNETDLEMSETMKLRHLLKKAKPTFQYEIRKKKPTTTKQFLEYAKEQEELLLRSSIDINTDIDLSDRKQYNYNSNNQLTSTLTSTRPSFSDLNVNDDTSPGYNQTGHSNSSLHNYKYDTRATNTYHSRLNPPSNSYNSGSQRNTSFGANRQYRSYEQFPSKTYRTNNTSRQFSSNRHMYPSGQRSNNNRSSNQHPNQTSEVNSISTTTSPSTSQPTPLLSNSKSCTKCFETGHQPSACPRF